MDVIGEVIEKMSRQLYKVKVANGNVTIYVLAKVGLSIAWMRLLPGDKVMLKLSSDLCTGKITGLAK